MRQLAIAALGCAMLAGSLTATAANRNTHPRGNVVIYRCTDTFGAVSVQNDVACPKGSRQERKVVDVPPPMPAYVPMPASAAPKPAAIIEPPKKTVANATIEAANDAPAIADADRLPPPPLFRCNTYDNDSYLSEDAAPPPRCVRMETVGLDGNADSNGGSVACQMVTDQCQRIADGAACDGWKQRLRENEATWKFAAAEEADAGKAEYERTRKIVRESTCGK